MKTKRARVFETTKTGKRAIGNKTTKLGGASQRVLDNHPGKDTGCREPHGIASNGIAANRIEAKSKVYFER